MKKSSRYFDILGWIGVALILGAYGALSLGSITANHLFQLPTLIGSLLVACTAWRKRDFQAGVLNVIFAIIAVIALIRLSLLH